jgi:hypothetical protein
MNKIDLVAYVLVGLVVLYFGGHVVYSVFLR